MSTEDTTLADFDSGYGGVARRAPAVQARVIADAVHDPSVAVIAWLGYDPPEGLCKAAVREDRAVAGARVLTRFLEGLGVTNPSATVAVVGHSYGTVVSRPLTPSFPSSADPSRYPRQDSGRIRESAQILARDLCIAPDPAGILKQREDDHARLRKTRR